VAEVLDLRGEVCPYTFIKTKLKLEEMESAEDLTVLLDDSAATANVSKSLHSDGYEILELRCISQGVWEIRVRKHESPT